MKRKLLPGEVLILKDDVSKDIFMIESGTLRAFSYNDEGQRVSLGDIHPGELVGESSFIMGSSRSATVEAVTDAVVTLVDPDEFNKVVANQHPWIKAILKSLIRRVRLLNDRVVEK